MNYRPAFPFTSGHVQTVFPTLFRRVPPLPWARERVETPDGDFVDIDWVRGGNRRVAVLCHGLEGDARRPYMRGMAWALRRRGWDVAPWNYRGCSGEPNRLLRSYHSGFTPDLATVIDRMSGYESIALVGFSLGGNLVLKYLGERDDPRIARAVAISAPVDLAASSIRMADPDNFLYMMHFMRGLSGKVRIKARRFPLDVRPLRGMRTFREFDGAYTAPLNGFASAEDYWARASAKPLLGNIRVPTLLLQAKDDPILTPECIPSSVGCLRVEVTRHGGHVGFVAPGREYYSERRAAEFLDVTKRS